MRKFSRIVVALVSCASVLCVAAPAVAEIIAITKVDNVPWSTNPLDACLNSDGCVTYDPTGIVDSGGGVSYGRIAGQSFDVTTDVLVSHIFLELQYHSATGGPYNFRVHEVADTTIRGDADPQLGTVLAEAVGLMAPPNSNGVETIVRFDLASPLAIGPRAGDAGYAVALTCDAGCAPGVVSPSFSTTIGSLSRVGGEPFHLAPPAGDAFCCYSTAFAIEGPIPEPASLTLLGLGSLLMLRRRRNA